MNITDNNGVLYFNSGTKLLPRLLVSIYSLKKVYDDHLSIVCIEDNDCIKNISKHFNINLIIIEQKLFIKHHYWFEKSRVHKYTPYINTIFLDSDTIVLKNFNELFLEIEKYDFIVPQFSNWVTNGTKITKRLHQWRDTNPDLVTECVNRKEPSVNVGVFGFNKDSTLMRDWFDFTITHPKAHLPEETSCQLLLSNHNSQIISNKYNASCKFDIIDNDTKIIHYHGRKHCAIENDKVKYNGDIWIKEWLKVYDENICDVQNWFGKCGDKALNSFMRKKHYEKFR